jgi:hypothetical protein
VEVDETSSSEEHTSIDQTSLEPSQPPAPTPHLSHYLRVKELLGTDREQDPLDHEGRFVTRVNIHTYTCSVELLSQTRRLISRAVVSGYLAIAQV